MGVLKFLRNASSRFEASTTAVSNESAPANRDTASEPVSSTVLTVPPHEWLAEDLLSRCKIVMYVNFDEHRLRPTRDNGLALMNPRIQIVDDTDLACDRGVIRVISDGSVSPIFEVPEDLKYRPSHAMVFKGDIDIEESKEWLEEVGPIPSVIPQYFLAPKNYMFTVRLNWWTDGAASPIEYFNQFDGQEFEQVAQKLHPGWFVDHYTTDLIPRAIAAWSRIQAMALLKARGIAHVTDVAEFAPILDSLREAIRENQADRAEALATALLALDHIKRKMMESAGEEPTALLR